MKEIFYCSTENEWENTLRELEHPVLVPMTSIAIDYNDSLYQKLSELNIVARLSQIKQLGLADTCTNSLSASGSRYSHSLICSTKIDYLAQIHNLERELGVFAGMLHDVGTPPLSDSVATGLDISDEEQFASRLEKCPKLGALLEEYSICKNEIIDLVTSKDKSPLGQLINSKDSIDVDRWSYANYDALTLGLLPKRWRGSYVVDPFKHIIIDKEKIVFTDIDSVSQLLESRTQMFEKVYKNPQLMAKEAFLEQVSKSLLERGIITIDSIFEIVDLDFEYIARKYGGDVGKRLFYINGFGSYGTVDASEKEVENFLRENTDRPFAVKKHEKVNPATETRVMIEGKIDKYKKWEPRHAYSLEKRLSVWNHTNVYGYEGDWRLKKAVYKAQNFFGIPDEIILLWDGS